MWTLHTDGLGLSPVDKETVDKVCDSVYDEVTEIYGSKNVQKHDRSNIVIEMVAALTKKAISAFKIQPLFSGGQSSTLFSYLDVDSIMQRIQHLPYKTFTKINRSLKENPVSSLEQLPTLIPLSSDLKNKMDTLEIDSRAVNGKENFKKKTSMKTGSIQQPICINISSIMKSKVTTIALESVGGMAKKKKGDEKKKETSIGKDENISKLTSTTTSVKSKDTPGPDLGTAFTKNEIKKKDRVSRRDEKGRGDELYQHLSPAMNDTKNKVILEPSFEICCKKNIDKKKGSSLGKGDMVVISTLTRGNEKSSKDNELLVREGIKTENDLKGKKLLGLASGGGQQIPIFSVLGADCTVLDYSSKQCESEKMVAMREGYDVNILRRKE